MTPSSRRSRPVIEALESRVDTAGFSPTALEQYFLEELNNARSNPAAYGVYLYGIDLSAAAPAPALAMNPLLVAAARQHSQDMYARGYFEHVTPDGIDPSHRIAAAGFPTTSTAESISYDSFGLLPGEPPPGEAFLTADVDNTLAGLIVDSGVPSLGHRIHMLGLDPTVRAQKQVGVGIADNTTATAQTDLYTIDSAGTKDRRAFLTGVAYNDLNGDGQYEPGEGLGGVKVSVARAGSTATLDAGGYSIALRPGTYNVTASGGDLPAPIVRTVVVGSTNHRLDFVVGGAPSSIAAAARSTFSGRVATIPAARHDLDPSHYSVRIDWGDEHTSPATLTPDGDGAHFTVSGANRYARPGTYATRVFVVTEGTTFAVNGVANVAGPGHRRR